MKISMVMSRVLVKLKAAVFQEMLMLVAQMMVLSLSTHA